MTGKGARSHQLPLLLYSTMKLLLSSLLFALLALASAEITLRAKRGSYGPPPMMMGGGSGYGQSGYGGSGYAPPSGGYGNSGFNGGMNGGFENGGGFNGGFNNGFSSPLGGGINNGGFGMQ